MQLKSVRTIQIYSLILILFGALLPAIKVQALANSELPSLDEFLGQVRNGEAQELVGVYIPGILAAPVVPQPAGMEEFVSPWQNVLTQFRLASRLGSTGLLAHNYLAGEAFSLLNEGQEIDLIYGDGRISVFTVTQTLQYRALAADSTSTLFVDPKTGASITSASLFARVYNRPGQVVFQTCIQKGDLPTWGRLFVIAEPSGK